MKPHLLIFALLVSGSLFSQTQPVLVGKKVTILHEGKFTFKDLNKNNKLDKYEDWRLPIETRIKDLVAQMTLEEKLGFMLISTTRMGGDNVFSAGTQAGPRAPITEGFNEEDQVQSTNMFTRKPLQEPNMGAAGTTKGVTQFHLRHFILRANTKPAILAKWSNNLQELCESSRLGIPAIVASNP
jgi:beta-glucosidase